MRSTVNEQGGNRLVEVAEAHGPLDVMCASRVSMWCRSRPLPFARGWPARALRAPRCRLARRLQFVLTLLSPAIGRERVRAAR